MATWTSSAPTVATISNAAGPQPYGVAKAVATSGSTFITATLGAIISPQATLTATAATLVSITVLPANSTIGVGYTQPYIALGTYSDGSTQNLPPSSVTWNSGTPAVATISNAAGPQPYGVAKALIVGTTSITATSVTVASGTVTSAPAATLNVIAAGEYLYATNYNDNTLSQYIVGAAGALTALPPLPVPAPANGPFAITVGPSGQYAYVANYRSNDVSQYMIGLTGALTALAPANIAAGNGAQSVAVDPTGQYAYTANYGGNSASQYTIAAAGAAAPGTLTAIAPLAAVPAGTGAASVAVDPVGPYVYVANYTAGNISEYSIGAGGALTVVGNTPPVVPPNPNPNPNSIVVDPTGRYVYVANSGTGGPPGGTVSQFTIGVGGVLTPMTPATVATGSNPAGIAVDPTGSYVYVANYGQNAGTTVSQYTISQTNGSLTPMNPPVVTLLNGTGPFSITVDPTGQYAYTANRTTGNISLLTITPPGTPAAGSLTPIGSTPAGSGTSSVIAAY
jgi:6-phosphogluconolactonase (cycloisomerase 2 family)